MVPILTSLGKLQVSDDQPSDSGELVMKRYWIAVIAVGFGVAACSNTSPVEPMNDEPVLNGGSLGGGGRAEGDTTANYTATAADGNGGSLGGGG